MRADKFKERIEKCIGEHGYSIENIVEVIKKTNDKSDTYVYYLATLVSLVFLKEEKRLTDDEIMFAYGYILSTEPQILEGLINSARSDVQKFSKNTVVQRLVRDKGIFGKNCWL